MPLLSTDALVLHSFDYLESSRILRLITRDGGVRSVLARGARRASRRFGSALDLFARGVAHLHTKQGRELDTLASFDITHMHPGLALNLARFTGASVIAELTLRFGGESADADVFDVVVGAVDRIAIAPPDAVRDAVLASAWRIVAELGVAPTVDQCAQCHAVIGVDDTTMFSHPAGGSLCRACAQLAVAGRVVPPAARGAQRTWMSGHDAPALEEGAARAHQRLLREFLQEHLTDGRPLKAFEVWEHEPWHTS